MITTELRFKNILKGGKKYARIWKLVFLHPRGIY